MTVIVTPGGSTSNSYATRDEATSYFLSTFFNTTWANFSNGVKDNWLIESTRVIDRFRFKGHRWQGQDQALAFPRVNEHSQFYFVDNRISDFEDDDEETPTGEIPGKVKRAQYLIIMYLVQNQSTTDGSIEFKEIEQVAAINNLVNVKYRRDSNYKAIRTVSGVSIEGIQALLEAWLQSPNKVPILR